MAVSLLEPHDPADDFFGYSRSGTMRSPAAIAHPTQPFLLVALEPLVAHSRADPVFSAQRTKVICSFGSHHEFASQVHLISGRPWHAAHLLMPPLLLQVLP